jgi:outer membrane protein W
MAAVLGALALAGSEARADAEAKGIEIGLRTGYMVPLGDINAAGNQGYGGIIINLPEIKLSDEVTGGVPFWIDAGYRVTPNIFVGGFLEYAILFPASQATAAGPGGVAVTVGCPSGASCSAHTFIYGLQGHYHFLPDGPFDPWVGVGIGYESLSGNSSLNGRSTDLGVTGWQFLNLQVGGDYKAMPNLGLGPFLAFSVGKFGSQSTTPAGGATTTVELQNTALHEWLTIGVRGVYDINLH